MSYLLFWLFHNTVYYLLSIIYLSMWRSRERERDWHIYTSHLRTGTNGCFKQTMAILLTKSFTLEYVVFTYVFGMLREAVHHRPPRKKLTDRSSRTLDRVVTWRLAVVDGENHRFWIKNNEVTKNGRFHIGQVGVFFWGMFSLGFLKIY